MKNDTIRKPASRAWSRRWCRSSVRTRLPQNGRAVSAAVSRTTAPTSSDHVSVSMPSAPAFETAAASRGTATMGARTIGWSIPSSTHTGVLSAVTPYCAATIVARSRIRRRRRLRGLPVPAVKLREVARVPGFAEPRGAQIPVWAGLAGGDAQVPPQVVERRAAPEPVAVIDTVNDQPRLEYQRVRDHGVVLGVGVLGDVQVLLDGPAGIGQEGPLGADRRAELLQGVMVVGGDSGDLGVGHRDLRVVGRQFEVLLVLFGAVIAAGQGEDHRIAALKIAELTLRPGLIRKSVVREDAARPDVGTHRATASHSLKCPSSHGATVNGVTRFPVLPASARPATRLTHHPRAPWRRGESGGAGPDQPNRWLTCSADRRPGLRIQG